jgi:hypothetical protein
MTCCYQSDIPHSPPAADKKIPRPNSSGNSGKINVHSDIAISCFLFFITTKIKARLFLTKWTIY